MNPPPVPVALGLLLAPRDARLLPGWLAGNAVPFDALAVLYDDQAIPANLSDLLYDHAPQDRARVLLEARPLNRDFAAQRTRLAAMSPCPWLLMLDADERLDQAAQDLLRPALAELLEKRPDLDVIGFPRENRVDGELVPPDHGNARDIQFRLVRRGVSFVNTHPRQGASPGCHEVPAPCLHEFALDRQGSVAVLEQVHILHAKSAARQRAQNSLYESYS